MDRFGQTPEKKLDGPSSSSLLCSKHFKETEGVHFCEGLGVPAQKQLKTDAVPTVFVTVSAKTGLVRTW